MKSFSAHSSPPAVASPRHSGRLFRSPRTPIAPSDTSTPHSSRHPSDSLSKNTTRPRRPTASRYPPMPKDRQPIHSALHPTNYSRRPMKCRSENVACASRNWKRWLRNGNALWFANGEPFRNQSQRDCSIQPGVGRASPERNVGGRHELTPSPKIERTLP